MNLAHVFRRAGALRLVCLVLLPLLLCGGIVGANWRRLHPPPTRADDTIRRLLLGADEVQADIVPSVVGIGDGNQFVTKLRPGEWESVVESLNLTEQSPPYPQAGHMPIVYIYFLRNGLVLGSLCTGYGPNGFSYFSYSSNLYCKGLHPGTVLRLRRLIASNRKIVKVLKKCGVKSESMEPGFFVPNGR